MKIIKKNIHDLHFAPYNPRTISNEEFAKLQNSIKRFGYIEPIIWNKRTGYVVGGNQRLQVLKELGEKEVDVVVVDLDTQQEKALNVALNKITGDWDIEKLEEILEALPDDLKEVSGFDVEKLGEELDALKVGEDGNFEAANPYTEAIKAPYYEPKNDVEIEDLIDTKKYDELINKIDKIDGITDEEKEFLFFAASRHIVFHYNKIADYYAAKATPEMQDIMEDLALVIIDYKKAIANGLVEIKNLIEELKKQDEEA